MFAGYVRVSRVGDRNERLLSPTLQGDRIKSYAAAHGLTVRMLDPELDVSGSTLVRPVLEQVIDGVKAGTFEGVIVAQLDRLSRMDLSDALKTIGRVEQAGGKVIAVAENFDVDTPEGEMSRNVLLSLANMQLKRYSAQFAAAKRSAVDRGIWPTRIVPYGYMVRPEDGRKSGVLLPDPETAPVVVKAFEMRAGGASFTTIAREMGKGSTAVGKLIRNRVYLGELRLKIQGEQVVNPTAHEPLVGVELWQSAQRSFPMPARRPETAPALLGGIVRCAACRCVMSRSTGTGGSQPIYRCRAQKAQGRCPAPAIVSEHLLDAYVESIVLAHLDVTYRASPRTDTRAVALQAVKDAEAELDAYQTATAAFTEPGLFEAGLTQRMRAVRRARSGVGEAVQRVELPSGDLRGWWEGRAVADRRHVLGGALGVVWVWKGRGPLDGRVRVIAAGFEPDALPRAGLFTDSTPRVPVGGDFPGELGVVGAKDVS